MRRRGGRVWGGEEGGNGEEKRGEGRHERRIRED